jgi:hypothetical protein
MRHPTLRATLTLGALSLLLAVPAIHGYTPKSVPDLTLYGDLRVRYEWDWDSQNAAGVARLDRDRARGRIRAGFMYKFGPNWTLGARMRTGNPLSQQSPHLTFHENDGITDDFKVQADRYYVQYKEEAFTGWAGRNTTPFWQQNEMWWDEDVTPTGLAASYNFKLASGTLTTTGAAVELPDGMRRLNGTLAGLQLKYVRPVKPAQLTLAGGLYQFNGRNGAVNLRNRNGARDYLLGVLSAQWTTPVADGRPLTLGLDLIRNFESYSAAEVAPLAASQRGEKNGYVLSALFGQLKNPRDWQVGYYYAHIETLAVNASYSQDDWARFGSATQADVTDFKGHEFRATVLLTKSLNLQARLFLVDAITSIQDGKRLRVDLNYKF